MNALIGERIRTGTVDHWIERLNAAGVPCGRVADLRAVFDDPQVRAQEMVIAVEHPGRGPVRMTGFAVKLSATPCEARLPAPELGAHTDEVRRELGLEAEIPRLRTKGIVRGDAIPRSRAGAGILLRVLVPRGDPATTAALRRGVERSSSAPGQSSRFETRGPPLT